MERTILSYPPLKERLEKNEKDKNKALKNIAEIASTFSHTAIRSFAKALDVSLPKLYDGINFNIPEEMDFKKLTRENNVVLVPNHQSHADYIALNYCVYTRYKFPAYIAGGINLDIFPIGQLFRKSGCFFIRRSFANDIVYKLTLEGYLHYLLKERKPIEFFFEGGRSRSGKLLPPRYGLFTMLLEAHSHIPEGERRPLKFVPVSIIHEYVPEQKSLAREMAGGKKKKETTRSLLKLFKLFNLQMGSVHLNLGNPLTSTFDSSKDHKVQVQHLAFDCFRAVGKKMMVTPTSMLALIMLDEPEGAIKWNEIMTKAEKLREFCLRFNVPMTKSLEEKETFERALQRALDILIGNGKMDVIGKSSLGHVFYSIKKESRMEILYFKNTILHHFLVPWIINGAWINVFNGNIKSVADLKKYFLDRRKQLKYEFYLPTVKQLFFRALKIISKCTGREIRSLEECLNLSHQEFYRLASELGVLSRSCSYITEGYFVAALTLKALYIEEKTGFKTDQFLKKSKDVFEVERSLARVVKYLESWSLPVIRTSLKYFENLHILQKKDGLLSIADVDKLDQVIQTLENELIEQLKFNMRV